MNPSRLRPGDRDLPLAEELEFFCGWIHQDYDIDGSVWGVVWQLLDGCTVEQLRTLADGIATVLALDPNEVELEAWFVRAGICVYPPGRGDGPTHASFLDWIRFEAADELARRTLPSSEVTPAYRPIPPMWTCRTMPRLNRPDADRRTRMLSHAAGAIEVHIASELTERPAKTLADDQWWLILDGRLGLQVDGERVVLGLDMCLTAEAGTRVRLRTLTADCRWLVVHLDPDPNGPPKPPHPGADL